MIINDKRALAYIVNVDEVRPLEGYDKVKYARCNGWWCIVGINEVNEGDKAVYFEIDSLVPNNDERFCFMEKRKYRVKTLKMCKVISQGLMMPLSAFPELKNAEIGTDVTDALGIKYYEVEDNARKNGDPNAKYRSMNDRHKKLFRKPFFKWLLKRAWGRKLLFFFFGKKRDKANSFPTKFPFVHKTDEERVENMPWILNDKTPWIVTEKLDGTSSTYILERKRKNKYEFYVLSRNVRQMDINQVCFHESNIYWEMALKYDIENKLKEWLESDNNLKYVALQGESVGTVQGNPLKLNENDLYVFNLIDSENGRLDSVEGQHMVNNWGMKWVPIIDTEYILPDTMEEMKASATGPSVINPEVIREGFVYRKKELNSQSFKNVSQEFLMSK